MLDEPFLAAPSRLAPGHAHVARDRRPLPTAINDEIMALRLTADRLGHRGEEEFIRIARAERRSENPPHPLAQGTYRACRCR